MKVFNIETRYLGNEPLNLDIKGQVEPGKYHSSSLLAEGERNHTTLAIRLLTGNIFLLN